MQSTTILHSCLVFLKLKVLTATAKSSLYSLEACFYLGAESSFDCTFSTKRGPALTLIFIHFNVHTLKCQTLHTEYSVAHINRAGYQKKKKKNQYL